MAVEGARAGSAAVAEDERAAALDALAEVDLFEAIGAPATYAEIWDGTAFAPASWDRCATSAERVAAGLRAAGVEKGTPVACVLTNTFETCTALLGTWIAGGTVLSLPAPARGMPLDAYAEQLGQLAQHAGTRLLLVDEEFVAPLAGAVPEGVEVTAYGSLPARGAVEHTPPVGDDVAFVQYSSGSTNAPKGCVLSAQAIVTHIELLGTALGIGKGDRGVTWLPLSHDMGLFGALLMSWMRGMEARVSTPQRFLGAPKTWMRDCSDWGATFTVTPNFGLRIAARAARRPEPLEPFPLRACIIGSDRIELSALEEVAGALGGYGLGFETLTPAYGLAEATLAVTANDPAVAPHAFAVDGEALLRGEVREPDDAASATRLVSCGPPLERVEVRIDAEDGADVGEICVRSPCLAQGYLGAPERTAAAFRDGELHTGDLGFIRDGELYVVGRKDDMISRGGRNVYASEIEAAMAAQPGVRQGNCVMLEVLEGDRSRLVVLAEPEGEEQDFERVCGELRAIVAERTGFGISEFVFVPRGSLPKTASGKIQRYRARQLASSPDLEVVARIRFD